MSQRWRQALIIVSLILALWSIFEYRLWATEQRHLAEFLERAEVEETFPDLAYRVRRANDPIEARIRATRPLLAHYLTPTWLFDVPEEERAAAWERSVATLEEIRTMAADAMVRQPTLWEAPMLYGTTTFLLQPRGNLAVSMSNLETWEVPLKRAQELTPQYIEPARYLTVAYIQHWQSLSSEQRREAREVLARAFEDASTFNLVIELWLRLVPDRREALALVPDEPFAWQKLEQVFRRNREWPLVLDVHQRYLAAEERRLASILDEAEDRVAGGDYRRGTGMFHQVASLIEPDTRNLPYLERILDRMPAGPVSQAAARSLRAWLEWSLTLAFLRESPLEAERLRRLAGSVPDAALHEKATAEVIAGDVGSAEAIERRRQGPFDRRWGPYLILKAEALLDRGALDDARLALLRVGEIWESHPTYLRVQLAIAEARNDVQTMAAVEQAQEQLLAEIWRGGEMTWNRSQARLEVVPARSTSGFTIGFLDVPPQGRLMNVRWNGGSLGTFVARPDEPLRVEAEVGREPSLLELNAVDNRPFVPGTIALFGAELPPLSSRVE